MNDTPIQLASSNGKTDADKAAAYRAELTPILEQLAAIILRARNDGFTLAFNVNADLRNQTVNITKVQVL